MDLTVLVRGRVVSVPLGYSPRLGPWDEENNCPQWQLYGITVDGIMCVGSYIWQHGDDIESLESGVDYMRVNGLRCSYIINGREVDPIWNTLTRITVNSDVRIQLPLSYGVRKEQKYPTFNVGLIEDLEVIELGIEQKRTVSLSRLADVTA